MSKYADMLPERSHTVLSKRRPEVRPVSDQAPPLLAPSAILQRAALSHESLRPVEVVRMQQTLGNRAVGELLGRSSSSRPRLQAKLMVNAPGDEYEREADRVAEQVMSMPVVERAELEDEDEEPEVMTKREPAHAVSGGFEAGEEFEQQLNSTSGQGQPLPPTLKQEFETRFAADFGRVRIHADVPSAEMNRAIQARAFAHAQDIYLGAGQYSTDSTGGKRLLAHELTHVMQQRGPLGGKQKASAVTIQRNGDKTDPGADLPKLEDVTKKRFERLMKSEEITIVNPTVVAQVKAREVSDAQRNVKDRRFMLDVFDRVSAQYPQPPRLRDLNDVEEVIKVSLGLAPGLGEAQLITEATLDNLNTRGRDGLVLQFFVATKNYSRGLVLAALGGRSEREYQQDQPEALKYDRLASTFLKARENIQIEETLTKSQKSEFAAALKKMPTIKYLLKMRKSKLTPYSFTEWKGGGSLSDNIEESNENSLAKPTHGTANPRDYIDNGKFKERLDAADHYIRTFVEPHLLEKIPRPKIMVHLKYADTETSTVLHQEQNRFRAYQSDNKVHVAQDENTSIIVHEVGHYLEDNLPSEFWHDLQIMLRARHLTSVEKSGKAVEKTAHGEMFSREEGRYRGEYGATGKYTSSSYAGGGPTEVTSMTLEFLSDPDRMKKMIENDPQQTAIVLRGLRPKEYAQTPELREFDHLLPRAYKRSVQ
jgi:hypothetical protein